MFFRILALITFSTVSLVAHGFTINITANGAAPEEGVRYRDCKNNNEEAFTVGGINTTYTKERSYSDNMALKLSVNEGGKGGGLGGIFKFANCSHVGGRDVVRGEEIWVRVRLLLPTDFEYNQNGRNKFLRIRMMHDKDGQKVSEGYNDLYIDGHVDSPDYHPFNFIFEGAQRWQGIGDKSDLFELGKWSTIEYYIRLDTVPASEGGMARVRVWKDGELIGDIDDRRTMNTKESYAESLYFFTYWDNDGAHKTIEFYADDITVTTDRPSTVDENGYHYLGMGKAPGSLDAPRPPKTGN